MAAVAVDVEHCQGSGRLLELQPPLGRVVLELPLVQLELDRAARRHDVEMTVAVEIDPARAAAGTLRDARLLRHVREAHRRIGLPEALRVVAPEGATLDQQIGIAVAVVVAERESIPLGPCEGRRLRNVRQADGDLVLRTRERCRRERGQGEQQERTQAKAKLHRTVSSSRRERRYGARRVVGSRSLDPAVGTQHRPLGGHDAWRGETQTRGKKGGGNFLEKRGNVWNEKESFTLSSNRSPCWMTIGMTLDRATFA